MDAAARPRSSSAQLKVASALATWFGCGRSPIAPGTVGALGALPLHFVLRRTSPLVYFAVVAGITALGVWAAQKTAEELGEEDPQSVVIDEVAGVLLALALVRGKGPLAEALAWGLFRLLDIKKPGPIDDLQHLKPEGVGIMADDVMAGFLAGVAVRVLSR